MIVGLITSDSNKNWRYSILITIIGVILSFFLVKNLPLQGIDDANITFVYARNIANGAGYVYTKGFPAVEGSTSLLWTLICAVMFSVHGSTIALITLSGVAITFCAILNSLRVFRFFIPASAPATRFLVFVAVLLLALNLQYFIWSVWSLMDIGLWCAIVTWNIQLAMRYLAAGKADQRWNLEACAAAGISIFARPEALVVTPTLYVLAGALMWRVSGRHRVWAVAAPIVTAVIGLASVTAWRVSVFGYPFPNTFYAKVSSAPIDNLMNGAAYLGDFMVREPLALSCTAILVGYLVFDLLTLFLGRSLVDPADDRDRRLLSAGAFLSLAVGLLLVLPVVTGGDHFQMFRFYQPAYLLAPAALIRLFGQFAAPRINGHALAGATVGFAVVLATVAYDTKRYQRLDYEFVIAAAGRELGETLNRFNRLVPLTVGVAGAGGVAYVFEGRVWDLLGLNWAEMAHANPRKSGARNHSSFYEPLFWKVRPSLFDVAPTGEPIDQVQFAVDPFSDFIFHGISRTPRFRAAYSPFCGQLDGRAMCGFGLIDWLDRLPSDKARIRRFAWSAVNYSRLPDTGSRSRPAD